MKIDKLSGRILSVLDDNQQLDTGEVANALDADRRKCLYRLSNKLVEADLVKEVYPDSGHVKNWRITHTGSELVDSRGLTKYEGHEHRMDEVEDMVETALRESESAKNSVQHYRGKVNYWMNKIEELESEVGDIEDIGENFANVGYVDSRVDSTADNLKRSIDHANGRISELEEDLEELESKVDEIDDNLIKALKLSKQNSEELEDLRDYIKKVNSQVQENKNSGLF